MKTIKELTEIVDSYYLQLLTGQLKEFILGVRSDKWSDEEEAAQHFFAESPHKWRYFGRLKIRAKKLLFAFALCSSPKKEATEVIKAHEFCYRQFAISKVLIGRGAKKEGIKIAESVLKKARQYEIVDLAFMIIKEMQMDAAIVQGAPKQSARLGAEAEELLNILQAEMKVQQYYCEVVMQLNSSRIYNNAVKSKIESYLEAITPYSEIDNSKIRILVYNLQIIHAFANYDYNYKGIVKMCTDALTYFEGKKSAPASYQFSLLYRKAVALIALDFNSAADNILQKAKSIMPVGTFNWNIAHIYHLICCFHQGEYQKAYLIYRANQEHIRLPYQSISEQWLIIEAFIKFFIQRHHITPKKQVRFRLGKFLNEVPIFSKDKAGNNVNILIIQILFLLEERKYGRIIDKLEALELYVHRYLNKPETKRAKYFIKMLLKLPTVDFHKAAAIRKTDSLAKRLRALPIYVNQNLDIEIVPYEVLWDEVLTMLEDKFQRRSMVRRPARV